MAANDDNVDVSSDLAAFQQEQTDPLRAQVTAQSQHHQVQNKILDTDSVGQPDAISKRCRYRVISDSIACYSNPEARG